MRVTDEKIFFTPEEMAAKLRISLRTLQQLVRDGAAPEHIKVGGRMLFPVVKQTREEL